MNNSIEQIKECIDKGQSFKLEAGAGSGKTWSLIESIKYILSKKEKYFAESNRKIACITYTNAAADEIHERLDNNPLVFVGTIHSFLWSIIGKYTKELKELILEYNNSLISEKQINTLEESFKNLDKFEYNLYKKDWEEGQLWHDDVIRFSLLLFTKRAKLVLLTINQFPYIFIDEYQDTFPDIVSLLLNKFYKPFGDKVLLGFFGDSMQNIYNTGIGYIDLQGYPNIRAITKLENYRCSKRVIELLYHLRPELKQTPTGKNKEGEISFYIGNETLNLKKLIERLTIDKQWNFDDSKETKILILTHRKIAETNGFQNLLNAFPNKERFFERGYPISRILFEIEEICETYKKGSYGEMLNRLRSNGFRLLKHSNKVEIKKFIEELMRIRESGTINEILDFLDKSKHQVIQMKEYKDLMSLKNEGIIDIDNDDMRIFEDIGAIPFSEITSAYNHIEKNTLFSTKHGIKGKEFNNVLVVIDDSAWNQFNDNQVLSNDLSNESRFNRSRNLLYVCCSRSKNNLALVSVSRLSGKAISNIKEWFGEDNVFEFKN